MKYWLLVAGITLSTGCISGDCPSLVPPDAVVDHGLNDLADAGGEKDTVSPDISTTEAGPPTPSWAVGFGAAEHDYAYDIAIDAMGNTYITGMFFEEVSFGPSITLKSQGGGDLYLAKLDPAGTVLWAISTGGGFNDNGDAIALDSVGNIYVVGSVRGANLDFGGKAYAGIGHQDIMVAKVSTDGVVQWVRVLGGAAMDLSDNIAVDDVGNAYVSGQFWEEAQFGGTTLKGNGSWDLVVAQYGPDGTPGWSFVAGGSGEDDGRGLAVDGDRNVYLAGVFQGDIVVGSDALSSDGSQDILLTKLGPNGAPLWAKSFGCPDGDSAGRLTLSPDQKHFVLLAHYESPFNFASIRLPAYGSWDSMVAKFDTSGVPVWALPIGSQGWDAAQDVAIDASGNIYVVGAYAGPTMFGSTPLEGIGYTDVYLSKLSKDGDLLGLKKAGGTDWDEGLGLAIDSNHAYISGRYSLTSDFDGIQLSASGTNSDIFVWRTPLP